MTNITVLRGNLTRDVELKYLPDGKAVAEFGLAVNEGYGDKKSVSFFNITAFGKTAENVSKFCGRGSSVCVIGKLKQDRWDDKEGIKRSAVKIYANNVEFLDKKGEGSGSGNVPDEDLEVPF